MSTSSPVYRRQTIFDAETNRITLQSHFRFTRKTCNDVDSSLSQQRKSCFVDVENTNCGIILKLEGASHADFSQWPRAPRILAYVCTLNFAQI